MRPGVNVTSTTAEAGTTLASNSGRAFIAGQAEKGPTDEAIEVKSMGQFRQWFGGRVAYGYLYDAAEFLFAFGASSVYVARTVGPDAITDTISFDDAAADPAIAVDSIGEYDSGLKAQILAGVASAAKRIIVILNADGAEIERSPEFATNDAAVTWGTGSLYVRVRKLGALLPAVAAATALAGGDDDRDAITDDERTATLDLFDSGLGIGQVLYPGATTTAMHTALLEHAEATNRFALLDAVDTPTVATIIGQRTGQLAATSADAVSRGMLLAPWATTYGVVKNTTRTTPYSIIQAGLIARLDGRTGNPNIPAAGSEGEGVTDQGKVVVLGLTQTYSDDDRELMNEHGVVVARMISKRSRTYGYRTLADTEADDYDGYVDASASRLRMAMTADFMGGGEEFAFDQITPAKIAEWNGYLDGVALGYYNMGALFGDSKLEAYAVDTGDAVNTLVTIADRQLNGVVSITPSPFAEQVNINLSRRSLAAAV